MRKLTRLAVVLGLVMAIGAGIFALGLFRASQQVPTFYTQALAQEPVRQKEAGDQLEREVLALNNQIRKPGRWESHFTDEQINGWLAADMPVKFPGSMPRGVSHPRVAIEPQAVQLAVRYQQDDISTVVSMAGDMYLTDEPNEVAVRIRNVRAGAVPIPLRQFLREIQERCISAGLALRWAEVEGDPVALVKLPLDRDEFRGRKLELEELRLEDGSLIVSGRTESDEDVPEEPSNKVDEERRLGEHLNDVSRLEVDAAEAITAALPPKKSEIQPDSKVTRQR